MATIVLPLLSFSKIELKSRSYDLQKMVLTQGSISKNFFFFIFLYAPPPRKKEKNIPAIFF